MPAGLIGIVVIVVFAALQMIGAQSAAEEERIPYVLLQRDDEVNLDRFSNTTVYEPAGSPAPAVHEAFDDKGIAPAADDPFPAREEIVEPE